MKTRPVKKVIDDIRTLSVSPEDHEKLIQLIAEMEKIVGSCDECGTNFLKGRQFQRYCSDKCSSKVRQRKYRGANLHSVTIIA